MNKKYGFVAIIVIFIFVCILCNLSFKSSAEFESNIKYIKENSTEFLRLQNFEIVSYCGYSRDGVNYIVKSMAVKNNILYKVTLYKNKDEINMNLSEIRKATN